MGGVIQLLKEWLIHQSQPDGILHRVRCEYDPHQGLYDNITRIITELAQRLEEKE